MAEENPIIGSPQVDIPQQEPSKRKWKALFLAMAVLFVAMIFAGLLVTSPSYMFIGRSVAPDSDSVPSIGIKALDDWNIEGKEVKHEELREKYIRLYNLTYPYLLTEAIRTEVIPKGVPQVYGSELGVSFEADIDSMTGILRSFEDHPLSEQQMKRYVSIGSRIACEYCCDAKTLVFADGTRACGCAHSYAMRGLAKYLLVNHPDHYTDDQILLELGKWKAVFFPKQTIAKAVAKYVASGSIDASVLTEMPNMVGSC